MVTNPSFFDFIHSTDLWIFLRKDLCIKNDFRVSIVRFYIDLSSANIDLPVDYCMYVYYSMF